MDNIRKIIREEIYRVMSEFVQDDPIKLAQDMVKSNEERVKSIEAELKYKEADVRTSGLPRDTRDARDAEAKLTKDRLEQANLALELSKQALTNAAQFSQIENPQIQQDLGQSQIQQQT